MNANSLTAGHDHYREPLHRGAPEAPEASGRAGEAGCGAALTVFLNFDGEVISSCRYEAEGASTAIAAGSALCSMVAGRSWREAAALPEDTVSRCIAGGGGGGAAACPRERAAFFAIEALHRALSDALANGSFPRAAATERTGALVAMSGGIDSTAAALITRGSHERAIGVTMALWSDPECGDSGNSCCSPEAIASARRVSHEQGMPHLTLELSEEFATEVVQYFVAEYAAGRTPNPCACCNAAFRFPRLERLADMLGVDRIVTGHYARIIRRETGGAARLLLARGRDRAKDQSYMLWGLEPRLLARMDFPLGELDKAAARKRVRDAGLGAHERPESQEVCFIPDNDYRRFLRSRLKPGPGAGAIVDSAGSEIGRHDGYVDFTIGQRRGLGVSAAEPLYVTRIDAERNLVVAGPHGELAVTELTIDAVNSFLPQEQISRADVQVRYNSGPVAGSVSWGRGVGDEAAARIALDSAVYGVAPGQSAVLYQEDALVAGGIITGVRP